MLVVPSSVLGVNRRYVTITGASIQPDRGVYDSPAETTHHAANVSLTPPSSSGCQRNEGNAHSQKALRNFQFQQNVNGIW